MNWYDHDRWSHFLAAIRAAPTDDLPRLVTADWLDELQTDEASQRAEWIRYACELPHCEFTWMANSGYCRPVELLGLHGWAWASDDDRGAYLIHGETRYWIDRGFVTRVSAPLGVLHGGERRTPGVLGELLRREPLDAAGVVVTDREPQERQAGGFGYYVAERTKVLFRPHWLPMSFKGTAVDGELFPTAGGARLALSEALYRLHGPKP